MIENTSIINERVRILYDNTLTGIAIVILSTLVLNYIYIYQLPAHILIGWDIYMFSISLFRLWLLHNYRKHCTELTNHEKYEQRYTYATGLVGIGWSFFIYTGLSLPLIEYQFYSLLVLAGIVAIAAPLFTSSIKALYFYILPPAIVAIPTLFIQGGNYSAIGLIMIFFTLMVLRSSRKIYNTIINTLILKNKTQELAENLQKADIERTAAEQRMQDIMDYTPTMIYVKDLDGRFTFLNKNVADLFKLKREEILGKTLFDILPADMAEKIHQNDLAVIKDKKPIECQEYVSQDDELHYYISIKFPLFDKENNIYAVGAVSTDITERHKNEENLRHNQKMEALGKLTGGIAHDFNNMLGVIIGFAELLKERVGSHDEKVVKYSELILNSADRAKILTSKLLNFSRKIPSVSELLSMTDVLEEMHSLLEKSLTPRIEVCINESSNIWPVWLDKTRLEDAILNICINSMYAMPEGGKLTLTTKNKTLSSNDIVNLNIPEGEYVLLSIEDTGTGIEPHLLNKIFDPFFTTKGTKGTGLGLSQVYGFIKQSNGGIQVNSKPGHGTRITLYFPHAINTENDISLNDDINGVIHGGDETILVVDDEPALVELTKEILQIYGYQVLCANSAEQALDIVKSNHIDLLLSDVIMPGMDGYQLAEILLKEYPDIKVQIVSGFTDDEKTEYANPTLHQHQLLKPFTPEVLLKRIRNLLDEKNI